LRVPSVVSRLLLTALALLVATLFAQTAKADGLYIDFSQCAACGGTVTASGGNFSTTGITLTEISTPAFYPAGSMFTLVFDTATSFISITGLGPLSGEVSSGTITSFSPGGGLSTTDLQFTAIWPTIPSDVQSYFNTTGGWDSGFTIFLSSSGVATSTDVTITPTPEPAAPVLLSAGLLGLGFLIKRKSIVAAASRVA
jgi:hypothetical protein